MVWYQILRNYDVDFSLQHCMRKKSEAPLTWHSFSITVGYDYSFVTMTMLCETGKLFYILLTMHPYIIL